MNGLLERSLFFEMSWILVDKGFGYAGCKEMVAVYGGHREMVANRIEQRSSTDISSVDGRGCNR